MDRQSDSSRFRQEMDNYITGHWGEDSVAPDPESFTFTFTTEKLDRAEATELLEFLNVLLNDDMHLETAVRYTVNDEQENDSNENSKI